MKKTLTALACAAATVSASADQIIQTDTLAGGEGDPVIHEVVLNQFDTLNGTRTLNFVQIDYLTSVIGGGQSDGSGIPVHIHVQLDANYDLAGSPLADTQALIDFTHPNSGQSAFTLFNTDTAQVIFDQAEDLKAWTGGGEIVMDAWTQFDLWTDPPKAIGFSAGGTVRYTVTYDFDVAPGVPGDVNGDGAVDFSDLVALLAGWGECPDCAACPADLDGSCAVDFGDLLILLANWSG